jgi:transposase
MLEGHVTVIVGNARDIKMISHKKTDKVDSELIAQLALKGMIRPSRVFPREHREFRSLVRLRHKLVQKRTDMARIGLKKIVGFLGYYTVISEDGEQECICKTKIHRP